MKTLLSSLNTNGLIFIFIETNNKQMSCDNLLLVMHGLCQTEMKNNHQFAGRKKIFRNKQNWNKKF